MRKLLEAATAAAAGLAFLLGAKSAFAGGHGVVFIHGTGDYPGTVTNSGSNAYVPAAYGGSNYWESGEVTSIANGRPFLVVGYDGGSCAPWPQAGDSTYGHTSTGSACPLPTNEGNADVIVSQIATWMSAHAITDIAMVTHSGGSNQARYILQNYTRNTQYTQVKNGTKRVVTVAGTTLGTYLANEVFGGTITSLIGGLVGFGGEGVNLLRTNYISTYNGSSGYFGGITNPVNGVNFYATGGVSTNISCVGVKIFGVCIGISNVQSLDGQSTPLSACDSVLEDTGLLALHDLYLDKNDSGTARNSCSDGFISCMGSQRLGNTFSYKTGQDHNQSRRQCNSEDVAIRNVVNGTESGFDDFGVSSADVAPRQLDACGFSYPSYMETGSGSYVYGVGCTSSMLGNGNCDWDCVALYGNDAVVTQWDATGTKPLAWGASDCTTATETYNGTTYATSSTVPFAENYTYTSSSGSYWTQFNGATCTGTSAQCGGNSTSTEWFYDPSYGSSTKSAGVCPQSWIGDGICDECAMFLYGGDGLDCAPGHITECAGMVTASQPYLAAGIPMEWNTSPAGTLCTKSSECPGMLGCNTSTGICQACTNNVNNAAGSCNSSTYGWSNGTCNTSTGVCYTASAVYPSSGSPNAVYNAANPSSGGYLSWASDAAYTNDGVCEQAECGLSSLNFATATAITPTSCSQCPGMLGCNTSTGLCQACTSSTNNATGSCNSTTYGWTGNVCNTSSGICYVQTTLGAQCNSTSDCLSGTCVNGGCTTLPSTSATDCSYSYTVSGGARACATSADCTGNSCQITGGTCSDTGLPCTTSSACDSGATCNGTGGTCLLTGGSCTSDASCGVPSSATSTCNGSGYCSCTTSADCSAGTCSNAGGGTAAGTCSATVASSLCR